MKTKKEILKMNNGELENLKKLIEIEQDKRYWSMDDIPRFFGLAAAVNYLKKGPKTKKNQEKIRKLNQEYDKQFEKIRKYYYENYQKTIRANY